MWVSNTNNTKKTEKNVFKDLKGQNSESNWSITFLSLVSSCSLYMAENTMVHSQPYDHLQVTHSLTTPSTQSQAG